MGLRFDRALDQTHRSELEHALAAAQAQVMSFVSLDAIGRTFAVVRSSAALDGSLVAGAHVDVPPLCILDVRPQEAAHVSRLHQALGGPGRPAGAVETLDSGSSVVVVWDDTVSPLSLLIDLADVETGGRRRISPLLPLSDRSIARLGADLLGIRDFDESRVIETHVAAYRAAQS